MKRLLIFGMICFLSFSINGCSESPDSKDAAPDKTAADTINTLESGIETTREGPEVKKKGTHQAIEDTKEMAGDIVEAEAAEAVDEAKDMASEATEAAASIVAGQVNAVPDIIEMKHTDAFSAHKMGIVLFSHKKHTAPAPDGYGITCGECHHDKDGKPLELKEGDTVQDCIECHDKTEKPKKPKEIPTEDWDVMQLAYYYGAVHANCIDCHKAGGAGPVKCAECHPKPEP